MTFENLAFRPQSQGGKICQAGPGILSVTFEPPRFGKASKGKPKEDKAKGILSATYELPKSQHVVADSGGPRKNRYFIFCHVMILDGITYQIGLKMHVLCQEKMQFSDLLLRSQPRLRLLRQENQGPLPPALWFLI